jgi:hypothetical protein
VRTLSAPAGRVKEILDGFDPELAGRCTKDPQSHPRTMVKAWDRRTALRDVVDGVDLFPVAHVTVSAIPDKERQRCVTGGGVS